MPLPSLAPLPTGKGTRFRVISARRPLLLLHEGDAVLTVRPRHSEGGVWEVVVPGVGAGQEYNWALDPSRPLLDPCCLAVSGGRSVVVAPPEPIDWRRPKTPWHESVVYELHVRGFTRHPSSGAEHPGTYAGLAERIGYLTELGVTAVELMPVHEFLPFENGRTNYWGYSPLAWCAPNRRYAGGDPIEEFRGMVRAFHAAGIQVILDVVFNHTAELETELFHLRALDRERFYLDEDYTGCGNTVRAQEPTVRAMILDALRFWAGTMGADGFRFDLATVLSRDERGEVMEDPPLIREIESDPVLKDSILIAEAWDAGGGYQVASWPGGPRWAVWNDRFRDDVRRAWFGHPELAGRLATRMSGSSDLFSTGPPRSLNFVTAHDGFTLRDAVSFDRRHNEDNGENGQDGHAHEVSYNHGFEGPTDDPAILEARDRTRRNLMATLLLSQGVPMLTAGDEMGRTQRGNNNAYCHDSELTWIDWALLGTDAGFLEFVRALIRLRRSTPALHRARFLRDDEVRWFGPGWESGAFGYEYPGELIVLVNLTDEPVDFELPGGWRAVVDTGGTAPKMSARSIAALGPA